MNLDIDFLKTFIAVADTKGFTSAGQLIGRTQSAVSMQIKRLENEVGMSLFERSGNSVFLTSDGDLLLKYARRIIRAHDDAASAIARPPVLDTIRFGVPAHFKLDLLPKLLTGFSKSYPYTRIDLRSDKSNVIKNAIKRGEIDIGLCIQGHEDGQVIFNDPLVWISMPGFDIDEEHELSLAVSNEHCPFRTWALAALDNAGFDYRIAYISETVSGILDAVRTGMAIAPVVTSTVPPDLSIIGIESGLPILPVSHLSLHISNSSSSCSLSHFSELLIKYYGEKSARRHDLCSPISQLK